MTKEKDKIKKDEYEKALSSYSQAMKSFHKGDYKKADELFKVFIDKHGSERELVDRAQIYLNVSEARQSKEKVPLKTFDDFYQYGLFKTNQGDYGEALKLLEKAREMKPKEGKILYLMADIYCLKGDIEKCLEHLKKAIQLDKYFSILARNERDFEPLWEDKKFKLITRMV
ncbi:MAG: tetratricopeptide repeat protein [Candidatus Aminicenantes bacterium]|nr:tetratricopeptide repeat protein [Candidatus Aminicenantes bacterium]